jgi:hypothetical protein
MISLPGTGFTQGPTTSMPPLFPLPIPEIIQGAVDLFTANPPQDQIQAGITRAVQGKCSPARRKFKVVTNPSTGQPMVISVCPPRRMNPLNPRALSRAARRLGSFQRIASHIEKVIQKACKTKGRSRSRMPARCGPRC